MIRIAETTLADTDEAMRVQREAFGGSEVPDLTRALLEDPTARPLLSLLAWAGEAPVGHILFTRVTIDDAPTVEARILTPLAVVPEYQRRGVGGELIEEGVRRLSNSGVQLVFVLGHPAYYPRHGFVPAIPRGLEAFYPVSPQEAWMVRELRPRVAATVAGRVTCADAFNKPEHWRE